MTAQTKTLSLKQMGNVPMSYQHEWRIAEPAEPLVLPGAIFKWYHVHRQGAAVPTVMDAEARSVIAEAAVGPWKPEYGLGFALLHLSTAHAFLTAGVWRGHQEMWERIHYKELGSGGPFIRPDMTGEDVPAACVWELGVICHERMAWHRYLFTDRSDAAKHAWLADTYSGKV